jgi:hypothetical protein
MTEHLRRSVHSYRRRKRAATTTRRYAVELHIRPKHSLGVFDPSQTAVWAESSRAAALAACEKASDLGWEVAHAAAWEQD